MNFALDHLGIAVKSLESAKAIYELLEPTSEDSVIAKFIAKRGEGFHHISLRVPDLEAAMNKLRRQGVRLVSEKIGVGAGGHRYIFVHPSSAGGILLELVESSY